MRGLRGLEALLPREDDAGDSKAILSCHRLTKSFGALVALNRLSFEVEKGVVFGIGGPNGAGKTTLFDLICGITPIISGDIVFNGRSIAGEPAFKICHAGIARTFQLNAAFETMTVRDNVLIASQHGVREREIPQLTFDRTQRIHANEVLEICGLQDRAEQVVSRLSLLDHKLMMIASALATRPSLLLLDEPVGGLTPPEIDKVEKVIRKLTQDHSITVILIEHVMRFLVGLSDQVMIINYGEKLYQGPAEGLAKDRQVVEVYLGEGTSARLGAVPEDERRTGRSTAKSVPERATEVALSSRPARNVVEARGRREAEAQKDKGGAADPVKHIDPVTFEVLRNMFEYACERMTTVMQRTSFSPILADMLDFSNAVYDPKLRLLAQAANCPVHLAAMQYSADSAIQRFPIESLKPGDVVALNDPYRGGTHINDITFTMPIFFEGELLGFAVSRGHWMDLGGGAAGGQSFGTHIAAEGLRLPPIKLYENYKVNEDFLAIIMNNTRTPHFVKGDLQAHLGALKSAEAELQRAASRYGIETVKLAMTELIAYTERVVRNAIEDIPNGVYQAEDYADTDGFSEAPVKVKVTLTVKGSEITVDFAGSDPICKGAINSPFANTASAAYYSLQFFLAPHAPSNAGMFAPIKIVVPDDCWLNAKWPAPTIGCTTIASSKITSAIWQALAEAIPDRVTGSTCSECNWFVASTRDQQGATNVFSDLPAGGWGGTPFNDGMNVTMDPLGNCMNLPAETAELLFPIEYEAFELRCDSAGPGKHRGGLGAVFKVRFRCDAELSMETARTREGSPGVNGGGRSAVQRSTQIFTDGREFVIGGLSPNGAWTNPLLAGHRFGFDEQFKFETTGGGGWGSPKERPPERVLEDVLDGYVSIDAARELYGVAIDARAMKVDEAATARLRYR
jgi:N-methylhydantoinase B